MSKMRVVWLSANEFGLELLSTSVELECVDIVGIITLSKDSSTKMYDGVENSSWKSFDIPVYEIEDINEQESLLEELRPDYMVMCGWRQIIDKEILSTPKKGTIGFHPTPLPKGRGPAPIINMIEEGWQESANTLFQVTSELDAGDIIGQESFNIDQDDYAEDVYQKATDAGKKLVQEQFPLLARGEANRTPQDEEEATYFDKPTLDGNKIDLEDESAPEIYRKIRARSQPYEGAYLEIGDKKLVIWEAELDD